MPDYIENGVAEEMAPEHAAHVPRFSLSRSRAILASAISKTISRRITDRKLSRELSGQRVQTPLENRICFVL